MQATDNGRRTSRHASSGSVGVEWLAMGALLAAVLGAIATSSLGERMGQATATGLCRITSTFGDADCDTPATTTSGSVDLTPTVTVSHTATTDGSGSAATAPDATTTEVTADEWPRPPEAPPLPEGSFAEVVDLVEIDDSEPPGGYDRDLFPHWASTGDGCNVREAILRRDFADYELSDNGCRPVAGTGELLSLWDGEVLDDPADVDIDHVRSLSEAWDAGAVDWTTEERQVFANDSANLLAVSASSNRSKGSLGPDEWLPDHDQDATCTYLVTWTQVSVAYELTVTSSEHDVLVSYTDVC